MAKKKFSKQWVQQHLNDPYVKLAQKNGYRARAAFKLLEIIEQEKIIKPGNIIIDLGSAPGSWSQVVRKKLSTSDGKVNGKIFALDLLPMDPIDGVQFMQGDFRDDVILQQLEEMIGNHTVDVVISDMAPNLSGIPSSDAARVQHICELATDFAIHHLKQDGVLVIKAFHGSGFSQIVENLKRYFKRVVERKPKASRDQSSETFLVARGLKQPIKGVNQ